MTDVETDTQIYRQTGPVSGFLRVLDCRVSLTIFMLLAIQHLQNKALAWWVVPIFSPFFLVGQRVGQMNWNFPRNAQWRRPLPARRRSSGMVPRGLNYAIRRRTGTGGQAGRQAGRQAADRFKDSAAARVRHAALDAHLLPHLRHFIMKIDVFLLY